MTQYKVNDDENLVRAITKFTLNGKVYKFESRLFKRPNRLLSEEFISTLFDVKQFDMMQQAKAMVKITDQFLIKEEI